MHGQAKVWSKGLWRAVGVLALLAGCNNNPYPDGAAATNTMFNSFDERSPRYLDPTASYRDRKSVV